MMKKKELILKAARELFNQNGFSNVTIRMIALKLNMSSGNLNYHFKKREAIFEALYFEMVLEFDTRVEALPVTEFSIKQIKDDISKSMERMIDYSFFWTDLYNLMSISEKVNLHFQKVYKTRIDGCLLLFEKLKEKDMMLNSSFETEYNLLAERMINHGNTWLYSNHIYTNDLSKRNIGYHRNILLSMLFPYLTLEGKKAFEIACPELF